MEKLTHIKKLANPSYIGSYELLTGDKPIELVVQIERIVKEPVQNGDKKEDATVMYLVGQKPMILNSTNRKRLEKVLGTPYVERMIGQKVILQVECIRAFGEMQDALRIKPEAYVPPALPDLNPKHAKWDGAKKAIKAGNTTIEAIRKNYSLTAENEKLLLDGDK